MTTDQASMKSWKHLQNKETSYECFLMVFTDFGLNFPLVGSISRRIENNKTPKERYSIVMYTYFWISSLRLWINGWNHSIGKKGGGGITEEKTGFRWDYCISKHFTINLQIYKATVLNDQQEKWVLVDGQIVAAKMFFWSWRLSANQP